MKQGLVHIYSGEGRGKSPAALGQAVLSAAAGEKVFIIQFLKDKGIMDSEFIKRMEPDVKVFRFEKGGGSYNELSEEKKIEENINIKNGLNFAKKVLATGECDLLILDEVLRLIDKEIITVEDLRNLLKARDGETDIILTGNPLNEEVCMLADEVTRVETMRFKAEA